MSTIYSKTSMVLKNPSVFFEEVRGEKLRHAMNFLAVLSAIPAVCAGIILIAVELPVVPSVTGAYDADVVAFLLGTVVVIYSMVIGISKQYEISLRKSILVVLPLAIVIVFTI